MPRPISGVLPIVHTPFDEHDHIDRDALKKEIDFAFDAGADGICLAMVSELLRLSTEERLEMSGLLPELAAARGAVVISVGAETTKDALVFALQAELAGCDAVMAIPPVTTALPEDALWGYFSAIASEVSVPVIVQDASSYVGRPMSISFCRRLLDEFGPDKILFKPEAQPNGPNISALRDATDRRAKIFDGSGGIYLIDSFRRGVAGTMPGVELLDGVVALWRALIDGRDDDAYRLYFPIAALVALQLQAGLDGFLAVEKYVLMRRGLFSSDRRRQPYSWSLDEETRAEVDRLLDRFAAALPDSDAGSLFPVAP